MIRILLILLLLTSCQNKQPQKTDETWQGNMKSFSDELVQLLPLIHSQQKFNDPKNKDQIIQRLNRFKKLSHKINTADLKPDQDPGMKLISTQLEEEIDRVANAVQMGRNDFARHQMKNITSYCIECHTRHSAGPQFSEKLNQSLGGMNSFEKADYYGSVRHFDQSVQSYIEGLQTSSVTNASDYLKEAKKALYISVRMQNNPKLAEQITQTILSNQKVPHFISEQAKAWKTSILKWKSEPQQRPHERKKMFQQAQKLIQQAQKQSDYYSDEHGFIEQLRAQSILSQLLAYTQAAPSEKAEWLFLIGKSYESTGNLKYGSLHEGYFQTCIETHPHSKIAMKCYRALEETLYMGYSGSSGLFLPEDVVLHLQKLKALALEI